MRATRMLLAAAVLSLAAASTASAQGYTPRAYYYPSAGTYATTAGWVAIPAPGYYFNVPAAYGRPAFAPAPSYAPRGYAWNPAPRRPVWTQRGVGPSGTPYYSSAVHSLHGRGFDSSRHR